LHLTTKRNVITFQRSPGVLCRAGPRCSARSEPEVRIDLAREVDADGGIGPRARIAQVDLVHLGEEPRRVAHGGVDGRLHVAEHRAVSRLQVFDGEPAALLHGAHRRGQRQAVEQIVADLAAQKRDIGRAGDLVADHGQRQAEAGGIGAILAHDRDRLEGGFAEDERPVEPREQAGCEGVGAGGHVHHHVLAGAVDQVVEQQFDDPGLGVEAGDTEVALGEGAGGEQAHAAGVEAETRPDRIVCGQGQETRSRARRGGLDHDVRRQDARIVAAQIVLDLAGMRAERRRGDAVVKAERAAEVLVDVGVNRQDRTAERGEVAAEQRRQRGLAAAALADEGDLHVMCS
jgi:hypothetical protein